MKIKKVYCSCTKVKEKHGVNVYNEYYGFYETEVSESGLCIYCDHVAIKELPDHRNSKGARRSNIYPLYNGEHKGQGNTGSRRETVDEFLGDLFTRTMDKLKGEDNAN